MFWTFFRRAIELQLFPKIDNFISIFKVNYLKCGGVIIEMRSLVVLGYEGEVYINIILRDVTPP